MSSQLGQQQSKVARKRATEPFFIFRVRRGKTHALPLFLAYIIGFYFVYCLVAKKKDKDGVA